MYLPKGRYLVCTAVVRVCVCVERQTRNQNSFPVRVYLETHSKQLAVRTYRCVHTVLGSYIHTCTCTCTCTTYIHTYIHTCIMYINLHTCTYIIHTYIHVHVCIYYKLIYIWYICMTLYVRTKLSTCICTCACMHIYMYTCMYIMYM